MIPQFDALILGEYINMDRLRESIQNPREEFRQFELACFVRAVRLLKPDVAFADGFFRTIHLPGGDS